MENLLLEYRKEFRANMNKCLEQEETELLNYLYYSQDKIERMYRRTTLLERINNLGLKNYSEEIIDGMNSIVITMLNTLGKTNIPLEKLSNHLLAESDAGLIRGLEYIDKWKMYNKLWKKKRK